MRTLGLWKIIPAKPLIPTLSVLFLCFPRYSRASKRCLICSAFIPPHASPSVCPRPGSPLPSSDRQALCVRPLETPHRHPRGLDRRSFKGTSIGQPLESTRLHGHRATFLLSSPPHLSPSGTHRRCAALPLAGPFVRFQNASTNAHDMFPQPHHECFHRCFNNMQHLDGIVPRLRHS